MSVQQRHREASVDADLIPARMCNEIVYCPRLFHLEYVQGLFVHSADTLQGAAEHARAQRRGLRSRKRSSPGGVEAPANHAADGAPDLLTQVPRRLQLASEQLGVRGEIDMVELDDDSIVVVEHKHGRGPRTSEHCWESHDLPYLAWPPDVVQVAVYMALLRDAGIPCDRARIYYRGSRDHASIPWSDTLEKVVHAVIRKCQQVQRLEVAPEPLRDSPKCPGCSLNEVCLPDEYFALQAEQSTTTPGEVPQSQVDPPHSPVTRRLLPSRTDREIVHVLSPGSTVQKQGERLLISARTGESEYVRLKDVAHVALFGAVHITAPCLQHLLRNDIPISHHTGAGRLIGTTAPLATLNIGLRRAQYRAADAPNLCLEVARALVVAKIRNQRTVLRRHRRGLAVLEDEDIGPTDEPATHEPRPNQPTAPTSAVAVALRRMHNSLRAAQATCDIATLRGFEGDAAASYFTAFPQLLPPPWRSDFCGRSRRPPRDRVNAMLSFGYALLVRDAVAAIARVGLDPMLGLYHTMIPGRPALALDIMEPFRAAWVDTAVLRLLATRGIERKDFHVSLAGVELSSCGRAAFIRAYERRGAEMRTHPRFGYKMSYRRLLELEARILAQVLTGELQHYTPLWTR